MDKSTYETRMKSFVGQKIVKVIYHDIANEEDGSPLYQYFDEPFHCLAWGVDLFMSNGECLTLTWGKQFGMCYSLDICATPMSQRSQVDPKTLFNQTKIPEWSNIVGIPVTDIHVLWDVKGDTISIQPEDVPRILKYPFKIIPNPTKKKENYPLDIRITFENEQMIIIGAYEYMGSEINAFYPATDGVTLFFDRATAKKYKIWDLPNKI